MAQSPPDEKTVPEIIEKNGASHSSDSEEGSVHRRKWWTIGGKDRSFAPVDPNSITASIDDFENHNQANIHGSVFDDHGAAAFYQPVEKYEGRHRFDPSATWTPEEENRLLKTVSRSTE